MNSKNNFASIITIGIVVIAILVVAKFLFVPGQISDYRTVNSQGTAEATANPDQAEAYLRIDIVRDTADAASTEAKTKADAVVTALKAIDGAMVETTSYTINKKEDWTQDGPVFKGYEAVYSLKVSTKNLDDIGKLVDAGVGNGANGVDSVQFTLSKDAEEKVRSDVLKQASENARMKASALAEGLNAKLGDILSVQESGYYAPPIFYAKMAETASAGSDVASLPVEPTKIQVTATVTVVFKLR